MKRRSFIKAGLLGCCRRHVGCAGDCLGATTLLQLEDDQRLRSRLALLCSGPRQPDGLLQHGADHVWRSPLTIQHFAAGELIPALEGFDAVSKGIVEMNTANSFFWAGKTFAAQYFTAVPFGLNFQGFNSWIYHGGGQQLWEEVYAPFNLVPMIIGNTGVQMTGWFRKPIEKIDDLKGLKMRIPGLAAG